MKAAGRQVEGGQLAKPILKLGFLVYLAEGK
jgi:hypothetical protein